MRDKQKELRHTLDNEGQTKNKRGKQQKMEGNEKQTK